MSSEVNAAEESQAAEDQGRTWRPSLRPDHQIRKDESGGRFHIVEHHGQRGMLRTMSGYLKLPLVRAFIGITLFIVAAIIFDATLNGGSWTEREPKQKATQHRAAPRPPPSQ
jgi:hypothetical protein